MTMSTNTNNSVIFTALVFISIPLIYYQYYLKTSNKNKSLSSPSDVVDNEDNENDVPPSTPATSKMEDRAALIRGALLHLRETKYKGDYTGWANFVLKQGYFSARACYSGTLDFAMDKFTDAATHFKLLREIEDDDEISWSISWVAATLNLGSLLLERAKHDPDFSFDHAIEMFLSAITFPKTKTMRENWIKLHFSLGSAYLEKAQKSPMLQEQKDLSGESRRCFALVINSISKEEPDEVQKRMRKSAIREYSRCLWFGRPAMKDVTYAADLWEELLHSLPTSGMEEYKAKLHFYIGNTLSHEAARQDRASLERAVYNFEKAIQCLTRTSNEVDQIRAHTQICSLLGDSSGDALSHGEKAVKHGQFALDMLVKNASIMRDDQVAEAYRAVGQAMENRTYGSRMSNALDAVKCYESAVAALSKAEGSRAWVEAQLEYACALCSPLLVADAATAESGLQCFDLLLKKVTKHDQKIWQSVAGNYALALRRRSFATLGDAALLKKSVSLFREIRKIEASIDSLSDRATWMHNYSMALFEIAGSDSENQDIAKLYKEAYQCSLEALELWKRTVDQDPTLHLEGLQQLLRVTIASNKHKDAKEVFQKLQVVGSRCYAAYGSTLTRIRDLSNELSTSHRWMFTSFVEQKDLWSALEICDSSKARLLHCMIKESSLKSNIATSAIMESAAVKEFEAEREDMMGSQDSNNVTEGPGVFTATANAPSSVLRQAESEFSSSQIVKFMKKHQDVLVLVFFFAPTSEGIRVGRYHDVLHLLLLCGDQVFLIRDDEIRDPSRTFESAFLFCRGNLQSKDDSVQSVQRAEELLFLQKIGRIIDRGIAAVRETRQQSRIPDKLLVVPHGGLHKVPIFAVNIQSQPGVRLPLVEAFSKGVWLSPSLAIASKFDNGRFSTDVLHVATIEGPETQETRIIHEKLLTKQYFPTGHIKYHKGSGAFKHSLASSEAVRECDALNIIAHGVFCGGREAHEASDDRLAFVEDTGLKLHDGEILSLTDIWALKLERCKLAVVVACSSGTTNSFAGDDESLGIGTAFIAAGAQRVVCSLWPVHKAIATVIIDLTSLEKN